MPTTGSSTPSADTADMQRRFRDAMAQVVAPVTVITSTDGVRVHGSTVSAFTSLSMAPPMVLVSLNHTSELLDMVRASRKFAVNVLAADQEHVARAFGRKGGDKFEGIAWHKEDGLPCLDGITAWVACDVADAHAGGDHVIVTGRVRNAWSAGHAPLSYHARVFGTHTRA